MCANSSLRNILRTQSLEQHDRESVDKLVELVVSDLNPFDSGNLYNTSMFMSGAHQQCSLT